MNHNADDLERLAPEAFRFYRHALHLLQAANVRFLLGGAYAFGHYTGISRYTKDLDVFLRRDQLQLALDALAAAGYRTELLFTHWLAKAFHGEDFVDLIFGSGNGQCPVDDSWFQHSVDAEVLGAPLRLMPAEEMIWQKAYIMERERFDGADVIHLLRARGKQLDWGRLLSRFGPHWRVLFGHLVLFGFVYPDDRDSIPETVLRDFAARLHDEPPPSEKPRCNGAWLSRVQYLADLEMWGFADPRIAPAGPMSSEQAIRWTDAGRS